MPRLCFFLVTSYLNAMILQFFQLRKLLLHLLLFVFIATVVGGRAQVFTTHVTCGSTFSLLLLFFAHLAFCVFVVLLLLLLLVFNRKYSQIPTCAIGGHRNAFNGFLPPPSTFFFFFCSTLGEMGPPLTNIFSQTFVCMYMCVFDSMHEHKTIDSINDHQSATSTLTNKHAGARTYVHIHRVLKLICVFEGMRMNMKTDPYKLARLNTHVCM